MDGYAFGTVIRRNKNILWAEKHCVTQITPPGVEFLLVHWS